MSNIGNSKARAVADLGEGTILATVEIAAPPERVYRALTSSEVTAWWGEDGLYRTTEWSGDVRVGGKWRAVGVGDDGKPFSVEGEYVAVDPPRSVTHTWRAEWDPGAVTTVTYRLEPIEGGTRVTLKHVGFTSRESCAGHTEGWARVLDWLTAFVASPATKRSFFQVRLIPPRPTFPFDMTDAERRVMMEHVGYWTKKLADGIAVVFGPVIDPKGAYGVGIVEVEDPSILATLEANDPAIRAGIGMRYEVNPMPQALVRPR